MIRHALCIEIGTRKRRCDDRAVVVAHPDGVVAGLADGATGVGDGHIASGIFIDRVATQVTPALLDEPGGLEGEFARADLAIGRSGHDCDTTGIVAVLRGGAVHGASVGDSEAWLYGSQGRACLTAGQRRKPRLGSGGQPVAWRPEPLGTGWRLLLGSDGLFQWLERERIDSLVAGAPPDRLPEALRDAVRAANGGRLPDDFGAMVLWDDGT